MIQAALKITEIEIFIFNIAFTDVFGNMQFSIYAKIVSAAVLDSNCFAHNAYSLIAVVFVFLITLIISEPLLIILALCQ